MEVGLDFLAAQNHLQTLEPLIGENTDLIGKILLELCNLLRLDLECALVLVLPLAGEDANVHHRTLDTWRARQRSITYITGFFTENGAKQLLFRRQLGLALRRYLADQDVVVANLGTDADHTRLVQVA